MSIGERGVKGVLLVIVKGSLYQNALSRYTMMRLGISKQHFLVNENHSQE